MVGRRRTRSISVFVLARLAPVLVPLLGAGAQEPPTAGGAWQERAPLPMPRFEMGTAVIDGELYVLGGFGPGVRATTRVDVYDPVADAWRRVADLPEALTHFNTAVDGGTLWIAGGFLDTGTGPAVASVWRYDVDGDRWHAGPALPEKRAGGGLAVLGGRLHYVGGLLPDRDTDSADHWVLDLAAPRGWELAAPMPAPRNQFGAIAHDGKLYVVGGQFRHDSTLSSPLDQARVDVYDPQSDRWNRLADLPGPLSHVEPSAFAHAGMLVVLGGRGAGQLQARVLELDLDTDPGSDVDQRAWRAAGELPSALLAPGARVLDGSLIVVGGALDGYQSQATTWALPWP